MRKQYIRSLAIALTIIFIMVTTSTYAFNINRQNIIQFIYVGTIRWHSNTIEAMEWSPDGKLIASGSADKSLIVFDTTDWKEVHHFEFDSPVYSLAWSSNGSTLAFATYGQVGVLNTKTWEGQFPINLNSIGEVDIRALSWSPDAEIIGIGGIRLIAFWDAETSREMSNISVATDGGLVGSLEWSPDGKLLAVDAVLEGGMVSQLEIWDLSQESVVFSDTARGDFVWSPDGTEFAFVHWSGIIILDTNNWDKVDTTPLNNGRSIDWSPDGNYLAAFSADDNSIVIIDLESRTPVQTIQSANYVTHLGWSPDSEYLAASNDSGEILIWQKSEY